MVDTDFDVTKRAKVRAGKKDLSKSFAPAVTPTVSPAGSVPDGKRADFLTGRLVKDTPLTSTGDRSSEKFCSWVTT